jgi:hypothetical protein
MTVSDHDQPYAPAVAYKLATVIPVSSELFAHVEAQDPASLWGAYWRRREFNQRRHPNPFPTFRLFGRTAPTPPPPPPVGLPPKPEGSIRRGWI